VRRATTSRRKIVRARKPARTTIARRASMGSHFMSRAFAF
jgi:hypothetical protein